MITDKNPSLFLTWDTAEILQSQAKHLVELGEAEHEEQGWTMACEDQFLLDDEWENLLYCLTEKLNEINPEGYWHGEVENFGWRKASGHKDFKADTARTFLAAILPQTDCTFHVYIDESHPFKEIKIQNFHHDSPMGNEWYTIVVSDAIDIAA